jgi:hypothetical protein
MSSNGPMYEVERAVKWRPDTVVEILKQSFAASPELVGSPGVFLSTSVAAHAEKLAKLYTEAFHRGDWAGAEFNPFGALTLNAHSFETDANSASNVWVMFIDEKETLLGATKLVVHPYAGTLIDETQIDPVCGRGRRVMPSYFRRIVPIFNSLGLPYWTEFMLTPGSRVLRNCLISELGMVVTGLRPACYSSEKMTPPRSVLIAYGPGPRIQASVSDSRHRAAAVFQPLLDVVGRGIEPDGVPWASRLGRSDVYQEVTVRESDYQLARKYVEKGYVPVAVDPISSTYTMARLPSGESLYAELAFLRDEGIEAATRMVDYIALAARESTSDAGAPLSS